MKILILLLSLSTSLFPFALAQEADEDPIEVQIGERLFNDDRFSFLFYKNSNGILNIPLELGDPSLETMETFEGRVEHPFRGKHMSCAACHMVDQAQDLVKNGVVNYNDFSVRSSLSPRDDGERVTLRHSPSMVGSSIKDGTPLHWDGEFYSAKDLSKASLVSRNMGWKNGEESIARQHIVEVILNDNGNYRSEDFIAGSYSDLFKSFGFNLALSSNQQIFDRIAEFMSDYMMNIDFQRDEDGNYSGSAFDEFVKINGLSQDPDELVQEIRKNKKWKWVEQKELKYHEAPYKFGPIELEGLRVFSGGGQCIKCHTPPEFTDHLFHNIGISQFEYQRRQAGNSLSDISIPSFEERLKNPEKYFIPTEQHPQWLGVFKKIPRESDSEYADLGVWNLFGHPDYPHIQDQLKARVCKSVAKDFEACLKQDPKDLLPLTVALFKTPSLRNLGQSAPYFHDGSMPHIHATLVFYMASSNMTKRGRMLNADPRLKEMSLQTRDFSPLAAFLNSLNEDYD